jgi:hypothetical protein
MGLRTYDSPAFKLSNTPAELTKAAPCMGEDNEHVYKELVGLSDDEFVELLADGAFSEPAAPSSETEGDPSLIAVAERGDRHQ